MPISTAPARAALFFAMVLALPSPMPAQERPVDYDPQLLPGDVVRLEVWREEEWSGEFPMDQFGVVALPLLGDVNVLGETQRSLKARVQEAYAEEIRNLSFQLLVLKRIRVTGEVNEPGIFFMDPTMSVADAIAMAGGRGPDGRFGEASLRRSGSTDTVKVFEDARFAELTLETGDELFVLPRTWLSRNSGTLIGSAAAVLGVLITTLIR